MKAYTLEINHEACWGCKACEVACKQENRAPDGVKLIAVYEDGPGMIAGKLDFVFRVNLCRHCDEPPCVDACPEEAITRRSDGIVVMDYALCTGCQLCIAACPYDAIEFDTDKGIAQKCNLCHHRIESGLIPACADNICPAHGICFSISDAPVS
ncbi:MAG: 4Fe-4S dicluster domain-containing protein [Desulfobacteraceae bacterium]|jgi:Fe-S-cluster-containing dehydrogenase component